MEDPQSNPIVLKVLNGTQRSDVNLCLSCAHAHVFSLESGNRNIRCHANYAQSIAMRSAVTQCNHYFDRTQPSLAQMQEIAWSLMTDKGGRSIGFKAPERRESHGAPIGF